MHNCLSQLFQVVYRTNKRLKLSSDQMTQYYSFEMLREMKEKHDGSSKGGATKERKPMSKLCRI